MWRFCVGAGVLWGEVQGEVQTAVAPGTVLAKYVGMFGLDQQLAMCPVMVGGQNQGISCLAY